MDSDSAWEWRHLHNSEPLWWGNEQRWRACDPYLGNFGTTPSKFNIVFTSVTWSEELKDSWPAASLMLHQGVFKNTPKSLQDAEEFPKSLQRKPKNTPKVLKIVTKSLRGPSYTSPKPPKSLQDPSNDPKMPPRTPSGLKWLPICPQGGPQVFKKC